MGGGSELLLAMAVCAFGVPLFLFGMAYFGFRSWHAPRSSQGLGRARALLNKRLAAGEIEVEEYYERESALRSAEPAKAPRRRLR